jgi:paraquat-inducible protein B
MAKQVSKTVIGGFVISAIALLVVGVLIFGSGKFFKKTYNFVLFFEGSIKGLKVGAPVVFRGVEVGSVEKIVIQADPKTLTARIPVVIGIDPDNIRTRVERTTDPHENMPRLIERGLNAQLTLESMVTGQLMIDLDFRPDKPSRLVGGELEYPEIPTVPSTFEELTKTVQKLPIEEIFDKLLAAIDGVEKVLSSPDLMDTITHLKVAAEDADKLINETTKLVKHADSEIEPLAESIRVAAMDAQELLRNVDGEVSPLVSGIRSASDAATSALVQGEKTLQTIEGVSGEDSVLAYELTNALKELSSAARAIRVLADYAQQTPDAVIRGKGEPGGK